MGTQLERIAEISAKTVKPEFNNLYHLINEDMLKLCHRQMDGKKAVGIDEVTKEKYEENLDNNIKDLVERLKRHAYKPLPTRRVFIPKANGKLRPLGIVAYEDKLVQAALKKVLEAVYEPRFLNYMYGFRPKRGCHEAIKDVYQHLTHGKINYIVDADIKGFFDHIDHAWMMNFLKWHITDPNILWLVQKYLKAGVLIDGRFEETEEGTIQGGNISPVLANIYMHNVLTLWFKLVVRKMVQGDCFLVNYADDFVAGFQYKSDAEKYYAALQERMNKFGLELECSKSRLIEFGRYAEQNRKAKGLGKPETFDFLGFTFCIGKTRKGVCWPMVMTSRKKYAKALKVTKEWLYKFSMLPVYETIRQLNVKLLGHYHYYGVSFNARKICNFYRQVQRLLFKALNRRSSRKSYNWSGFVEMLKYYPLVQPKIYCSLY
ncbi:MAG: group II intron reverse transcriptase/maturase [Lachnospiraceae bacterium]|nr:group II intron reverse transcriptase/maturase [Lachnospiraceae bacterium]